MTSVRDSHGIPEIKIYTTHTCAYSRLAKNFFRKYNIVFTEHNIAFDPKAREEMVRKSRGMSVPVIDIDGEIFVGFNEKAIAERLKLS